MAEGSNTGAPLDVVEVRLLSYRFAFKRLSWREEMGADPGKGADPIRTVLARALASVSGLVPGSPEEARKVVDAIPEAIATRVWKVYRGSFPPARRFSAADLYMAPEPTALMARREEDEAAEEDLHARTIREMETRFGKEEVAAEAELSRKVLAAARRKGGFAGASRPSADREDDGG